MGNEEHLKILKQGVEAWNRWRQENPETIPDLSEVDLEGASLAGINLDKAELFRVRLINADLANARLAFTYPGEADLDGANLSGADLAYAHIEETSLTGANLTGADVHGATFKCDLSDSCLEGANLTFTTFDRCRIDRINLTGATLSQTILAAVDLRTVKGLDSVKHEAPSTIGLDTIVRSKGEIPESFLRGCGLSDADIEFVKLARPGLSNEEVTAIGYRIIELRATQAIQIQPLFISYSNKDGEFVDKVEGLLKNKGIRFWRDIHDAVAGRLETQIDRAIRQNPTVLLILSERSVESDWVELEVRKARELEKALKRDVICPVALDASWKACRWPERLREQIMEYNILDFSKWRDAF